MLKAYWCSPFMPTPSNISIFSSFWKQSNFSLKYFLKKAFLRDISPNYIGGFGCYRHEWVKKMVELFSVRSHLYLDLSPLHFPLPSRSSPHQHFSYCPWRTRLCTTHTRSCRGRHRCCRGHARGQKGRDRRFVHEGFMWCYSMQFLIYRNANKVIMMFLRHKAM